MKDRKSGKVTIFESESAKLTPAQLATLPRRVVDCVDCHNRPSHIYTSPDRAVDRAITARQIDPALPFVKQQSVAVLAKDYNTTADALRTIAAELPAYYQTNYADLFRTRRADIDRTVKEVQEIFTSTRFPEMRVDWRTHPDNVGHFTSMGCFRCHDDQHVSSDGKRIIKDCQICHSVLTENQTNAQFEHPVDLGDLRRSIVPTTTPAAECKGGHMKTGRLTIVLIAVLVASPSLSRRLPPTQPRSTKRNVQVATAPTAAGQTATEIDEAARPRIGRGPETDRQGALRLDCRRKRQNARLQEQIE